MDHSEHENVALMNVNSDNNNDRGSLVPSSQAAEYRVDLDEEEEPKSCKRFMPLIFELFVLLLIIGTIIYIIYCIFEPESQQMYS